MCVTAGADVLELDDHSIAALATLPMARARRLARLLQQATALFDCVATRTLQPRLSEVELRLWLVAQGCSAAEAGEATMAALGRVWCMRPSSLPQALVVWVCASVNGA